MAEEKRTAQATKQNRSNGPGRKVLHVADFQYLYELSDDVRKERSGPLRYTRSLVTLSPFASDAESRYFERLCRLKAHPERHLLRSILADVVNWTAAKPFGIRGFLVTAEGKVASCEYLAEQIGVSVDEIAKALPVLEQLGFLERIRMDGQAEPKPKRPRTRGKTASAKTSKKPVKKSKIRNKLKAQNAAKSTVGCSTKQVLDSAGTSRNEPESLCPPSRKNKDKGNSKVKDNQKATSGLTAPGCKRNNNGNGISAETNDNAQNKCLTENQGQEPLPSEPHESDAQGGDLPGTCGKSPPGPVKSKAGHRRADITDCQGVYDHSDVLYGQRVYRALGLGPSIDDVQARREITSFASVWHQCRIMLDGLSPPEIDILGIRGIHEAEKIYRRSVKKKNKSGNLAAIWNDLIKKICSSRMKKFDIGE